MAVPSYNDLLTRHGVQRSDMADKIHHTQLMEISPILDQWEMLGRSLGLDNSDIVSIKRERDTGEEKRDKMLQRWKQRRGSAATYEELTTALLRIRKTDLAEIVISMRLSLAMSTLPASSGEVERAKNVPLTTNNIGTTPTSSELEQEFYQLVKNAEIILEKHDIRLDKLARQFRMLPQSISRYQTAENYRETRSTILKSTTIKELFKNLTDLKHWNYMMPDTLAHLLKDDKIDDAHQTIDKYKEKLSNFKMRTKLVDLIGTHFPVPEYCIELTMEVKGWEDKTIEEAEKAVGNIISYGSCGQNVHLGWKGVEPGSMKLTFILLEPIKITPDVSLDAICGKYTGVMNIKLDGDILYMGDHTKLKEENRTSVPEKLWQSTGTTPYYSAGGGRDILIISADPPPHQPEAVARRPGQLTEEDKQKLLRQAVTSDCQSEVDIVRARYELDKRCEVVDIMSGHSLTREEVSRRITHFLNTTKNDGVGIYYIGAGRRDTGDWCFEDGFITFRDIAQLYLQSKLRGRVLSIVSDCSYSGRWVRDCMEFLDEQGVQPCGHKAREKGIIIKMCASCKSNQIPTGYCFSISGVINNKNTGEISFWSSKQLLDTQTTYGIDSSLLRCSNKSITEQCTLKPGYAWRKKEEGRRVYLVRGKDRGRPAWHYVLVVDDEDTMRKFLEKVSSGQVDVADYGRVLHSGWGEYPPNDIRERIEEEYLC